MNHSKLVARDLTIFATLGAIMFLSRMAMLAIPNVHLLAMFIASFTLVYRAKALIPIYVWILIEAVAGGAPLWLIPYLYVWLPLWGVFMILGRFNIPNKVCVPLYMVICALHGLTFDVMYSPWSMYLMGLPMTFEAWWAYIVAGLWWSIAHAIGNFAAATLIIPLATLMGKLHRKEYRT